MAESSTSYIRLVQHLIEECILFKMSKEECEEALSKHANINPVVTSTVWKELEKENKGFFEEYANATAKRGGEPAISSAAPTDHSHSHNELLQPEVEEIQLAEEGDHGSP